jgi:outer membrane usher protein
MINYLTGPGKKSYFLNLTYAMDDNTFLNGNYTNIEGAQNKSLQIIRQLPVGPGYGYSLSAQRGSVNQDAGSLSLQNDIGTYVFRTLASQGQTTNTLDVQGAALYMSRNFKLSRTITTSFGYVHIPNFENIGIYYENQLISTTDKNGFAFVPNLLPYQKLKVNIDPNSVPLDSQIDKFEDYVIPYRNAGAVVEFKVTEIRSAVFTLKQESGSYVPEGSDISIVDNENTFVTGGDGQVFVTNLPEQFTGHVVWGGGACVFNVTLPKPRKDNPIPDIGIITCKAETPAAVADNKSQDTANNPASTATTPKSSAAIQPTSVSIKTKLQGDKHV